MTVKNLEIPTIVGKYTTLDDILAFICFTQPPLTDAQVFEVFNETAITAEVISLYKTYSEPFTVELRSVEYSLAPKRQTDFLTLLLVDKNNNAAEAYFAWSNPRIVLMQYTYPIEPESYAKSVQRRLEKIIATPLDKRYRVTQKTIRRLNRFIENNY
jgi:hypothetical protein